MLKSNKNDIANSFLVKNAIYDGNEEIPRIKTSNLVPKKLISFSKALNSKDYDAWVHFYENDSAFERFWNRPKKYLPILKKFKGVITPDFSLYYDMPLVMQAWNTYRGKALGHWLNKNHVEVIPNVRWGDKRTFALSTCGIEKGKTIAVGTHGCIKTTEEKLLFIQGFDYVIHFLKPHTVIVYGKAPDKIFSIAKMQGINIVHFESEFALTHKKGVM